MHTNKAREQPARALERYSRPRTRPRAAQELDETNRGLIALHAELDEARAADAGVSVSAGEEVGLRVTDGGTGLQRVTRSRGLRNLRHRAESLVGTFAVNGRERGGTHLEWRIPLRVC